MPCGVEVPHPWDLLRLQELADYSTATAASAGFIPRLMPAGVGCGFLKSWSYEC